jgi:anti-anti-sigma factor
MNVTITCPNGHSVSVSEDVAGRVCLCPLCHARMVVPILAHQMAGAALSGDLAHQSPRSQWVPAEPASSSPSFPIPLKKKTRQCLGCGNVVSPSFTACPRCGTSLSPCRHLSVQKQGEVITVGFAKSQMRDEQLVGEIAEELCSIAERAQQQHLVLDFSGVVGVSSIMLGKLVMLQARMKKQGGNLRLYKVGPEVRSVLAAMKLDRTLHVDD